MKERKTKQTNNNMNKPTKERRTERNNDETNKDTQKEIKT